MDHHGEALQLMDRHGEALRLIQVPRRGQYNDVGRGPSEDDSARDGIIYTSIQIPRINIGRWRAPRRCSYSILEAVVDRGRAVDLLSWLQGDTVLLGGISREGNCIF
jgi:hypothetical protein